MGADRSDHEDPCLLANQWSARRQGISCRSRRSCHNQSVSPVVIEEFAIHPGLQRDESSRSSAHENNLVERHEPVLHPGLVLHGHLQHHPLDDLLFASRQHFRKFVHITRRAGCQESQSPDIHSRHRNLATPHSVHGIQEGAITTQGNHELGSLP